MTYVPTKEIKIKERQDKFLKAQLEKEREQALLEEIEKTEKERVKKKGLKVLKSSGILDAYQGLLVSLCKYGLPTEDLYEFSALTILKHEKKLKAQRKKELEDRLKQRYDQKQLNPIRARAVSNNAGAAGASGQESATVSPGPSKVRGTSKRRMIGGQSVERPNAQPTLANHAIPESKGKTHKRASGKGNKDLLEVDPPVDEVVPEEKVKKSKKSKKSSAVNVEENNEDENQEAAAEDEVPRKKKKKKASQASVEEDDALAEDAPPKKKKKRTRDESEEVKSSVRGSQVTLHEGEDGDAEAPKKKKKKRSKESAAAEEEINMAVDADAQEEPPRKKKKKSKRNEEAADVGGDDGDVVEEQ